MQPTGQPTLSLLHLDTQVSEQGLTLFVSFWIETIMRIGYGWLLALFCRGDAIDDTDLNDLHRIVGGSQAARNDYPFFSAVYADNSPICGGSLIHTDFVLTAAHCSGHGDLSATVNAYSSNERDYLGQITKSVLLEIPHPQYNSETVENDVMLLRLSSPVEGIEPVTLNSIFENPAKGEKLQVMGLGLEEENGTNVPRLLRHVMVPSVDQLTCEGVYGAAVFEESMICAGDVGKDSCQGDSGGPLLTGIGDQVGIVSWGVGCGRHLGVYARVSAALEWIQDRICTYSGNPPTYCDSHGQPLLDLAVDEAVLKINILVDAFPNELAWKLKRVNDNALIDNRDEMSYRTTYESVVETVVVTQGETYSFEITDAAKDGICCGWGEGAYSLVVGGETVVNRMGDYGESVNHSFAVPILAATPKPTSMPTPGPSPVSTVLTTVMPTARRSITSCEDDGYAVVFVDDEAGFKPCAWLREWIAKKPTKRFDRVCHAGHDAFSDCKETCKNCDGGGGKQQCLDDPSATFVYKSKNRDCEWLRRRRSKHAEVCVHGHVAYDLCPDTCNQCINPCKDDDTFKFTVKNARRTCLWLSTRSKLQEKKCKASEVQKKCERTCGTCEP